MFRRTRCTDPYACQRQKGLRAAAAGFTHLRPGRAHTKTRRWYLANRVGGRTMAMCRRRRTIASTVETARRGAHGTRICGVPRRGLRASSDSESDAGSSDVARMHTHPRDPGLILRRAQTDLSGHSGVCVHTASTMDRGRELVDSESRLS